MAPTGGSFLQTGGQGHFEFGAWRISLAEGVGKASGLDQSLAEPAAVFLYRGETRELAERLGIDCSRFPGPDYSPYLQREFPQPRGLFSGDQVSDAE
jgi:polysaccharide export outer membrane protein